MQIHQFPTMGAPSGNDLYLVSHNNTVFSVKHQTIVEAAGEQAKNLIANSHGTYNGNIDDIRVNSMYWCSSAQGGATGTFPNSVYPEITGTNWQIETHSVYDSGATLLQLAWYRSGKPYMFARRYSKPSDAQEGTWSSWVMYADKDSMTSELTAIKNRLDAVELSDSYTHTLANNIVVSAYRNGKAIQLYLRSLEGGVNTELATGNAYVELDTLPEAFRPRVQIVNYTWIGSNLFGQLNVESSGLVKIGYTRKINAVGETRKKTVAQTAPEFGDKVDIIVSTNLLQSQIIYANYLYLARN